MFYKFPIIENISEIEHIVAECDEFIIAEKDGYKVVNYLVSMEGTFPPVETRDDALRRELRGMVFNEDGSVLSRRFHKFFNVNEREETQIHHFDVMQPHVILEKLDGSMITPLFLNGGFRWGTKMGITDTSMMAEDFVMDNPQYVNFVKFCHGEDITPIFEFMSRRNRIVVDHPEDRMVLLAMRDNLDGYYYTYPTMVEMAAKFGIDVVRAYEGTVENMKNLVEETRGIEGAEGWVVRFDNGHMVKIKSEWYVNLHRTKDAIRYERNLVRLIIDDQLDDLKAFMLQEDIDRVEKYHFNFRKDIAAIIDGVVNELENTLHMSRKEYALSDDYADKMIKPLIFKLWDYIRENPQGWVRPKVREIVLNTVGKGLSTNKKFDANIKPLLPSCRWNEGEE